MERSQREALQQALENAFVNSSTEVKLKLEQLDRIVDAQELMGDDIPLETILKTNEILIDNINQSIALARIAKQLGINLD